MCVATGFNEMAAQFKPTLQACKPRPVFAVLHDSKEWVPYPSPHWDSLAIGLLMIEVGGVPGTR